MMPKRTLVGYARASLKHLRRAYLGTIGGTLELLVHPPRPQRLGAPGKLIRLHLDTLAGMAARVVQDAKEAEDLNGPWLRETTVS